VQICIKLFAMIPEKQQPCAFSLGHSGLPGPPRASSAGPPSHAAAGSAVRPPAVAEVMMHFNQIYFYSLIIKHSKCGSS